MDDRYVRWVAGAKGCVVVEDSAAIDILYLMVAHTAAFSGGSQLPPAQSMKMNDVVNENGSH